jgi:hypothetical protein
MVSQAVNLHGEMSDRRQMMNNAAATDTMQQFTLLGYRSIIDAALNVRFSKSHRAVWAGQQGGLDLS